ncbi:hypothetical protein NEHOM01_1639 [Nematocida homosporus]|uniref:uncharacterized protein n=1 Tax=Nematocida homosporus TaxID=1912981 RepID=UPI00221EB41F|nr:uncharacterized protein NEHOM01_1639 [Nematocida homosporus]KAI5186686.1 hypothetical protein NEHOM01_1639 [Nematocida homosporus]
MNQRIVEIHGLRGERKIVEIENGQSVYVADIEDSVVVLRGKCIKVMVVDTKKSLVAVESLVSNLEVTRAKNTVIGLGKGNMINVEQSVECRIGLGSEETEIRLRRNTSISAVLLGSLDWSAASPEEIIAASESAKELFLPEEIKAIFCDGKLSTGVVKE